jgi:hypothetical protein
LLTVEIGGEEFSFMVDTGAMVSIVQPRISEAQVQACDVQARGVTGTQILLVNRQLSLLFGMRAIIWSLHILL